METKGVYKFKLSVSIGFASSQEVDYEIEDKTSWDSKTEEEREKFLENAALEVAYEYLDCGWEPCED